jgi:hypothetical protein
MLKIYCIGIIVLLIAILANVLASVIGVMSWYDAFSSLQKNGWASLKDWSWKDYVWLFVLYPVILGAAGYYGLKLYELIVK